MFYLKNALWIYSWHKMEEMREKKKNLPTIFCFLAWTVLMKFFEKIKWSFVLNHRFTK